MNFLYILFFQLLLLCNIGMTFASERKKQFLPNQMLKCMYIGGKKITSNPEIVGKMNNIFNKDSDNTLLHNSINEEIQLFYENIHEEFSIKYPYYLQSSLQLLHPEDKFYVLEPVEEEVLFQDARFYTKKVGGDEKITALPVCRVQVGEKVYLLNESNEGYKEQEKNFAEYLVLYIIDELQKLKNNIQEIKNDFKTIPPLVSECEDKDVILVKDKHLFFTKNNHTMLNRKNNIERLKVINNFLKNKEDKDISKHSFVD